MIPRRARFRPNRSTGHSPEETRAYAQQARLQRLCRRTPGEIACEEIIKSLGVSYRAEWIIFCGNTFVILDFLIETGHTVGLAVEADGGVHKTQKGYDRDRDKYLKELGIKTLRVSNTDILKRPDMVKQRILEAING